MCGALDTGDVCRVIGAAEFRGVPDVRLYWLTDWDGDGKFDFLLNSSNADFLQQTGTKDGMWVFRNAGSLAKKNIEGHDVSPAVVDFDGNGVPDFLGGAEDGRFYLLQNPR